MSEKSKNASSPISRLNPGAQEFLEAFFGAYSKTRASAKKERNSEANSTAVLYEKFRVGVEYQEEHLIFKNAISRIARRKFMLIPGITAEVLFEDLVRELSWANYINPELLDDKHQDYIKKIIRRYLVILNHLNSGLHSKMEVQKKILDWMACEIEDFLKPQKENEALIDFAYPLLEKNLKVNTRRINSEDNELFIKTSVFMLLFKPDLTSMEYFLIKRIYPDWEKYTDDEAKRFGRSFSPYYNKIDRYLSHPLRNYYLRYVKRFIPAFLVLRSALLSGSLNAELIKNDPLRLELETANAYRNLIISTRTNIFRATLRALIFIFLTKTILAFIVEIPYDRLTAGEVNYIPLLVNITIPPFLMFLSGAFTKIPSKKNGELVQSRIANMIYTDQLSDKKYNLIEARISGTFVFFNFVYGIFNLAILAGAIWLLVALKFNIVSVVLFFIFVSIVSFFSFRIRSIVNEVVMEKVSDDAITSIVEFLFLPFIKIGKYISSQFTHFNPFILMLDFLIEAPLKTILRIVLMWRGFVNKKREELEY